MKLVMLVVGLILTLGVSAQGVTETEQAPGPAEAEPALGGPENPDDPLGREVAAFGTLKTLDGILQYFHDEWHLEADSVMYELHMGPTGHDSEDLFPQGTAAAVRGFVLNDHISPVSIRTAELEVRYWTEERHSVWAGSGEGAMRRTDGQQPEEGIQRVSEQGERGEAIPLQQRLLLRQAP